MHSYYCTKPIRISACLAVAAVLTAVQLRLMPADLFVTRNAMIAIYTVLASCMCGSTFLCVGLYDRWRSIDGTASHHKLIERFIFPSPESPFAFMFFMGYMIGLILSFFCVGSTIWHVCGRLGGTHWGLIPIVLIGGAVWAFTFWIVDDNYV